MFDNKGQSSSVFNLLIAALVSLAILGLLLSILGGIGTGSTDNPSKAANDIMKNASQNSYQPYSNTITFTKTYKSLSSKGLAEKLDIGQENIQIIPCVSDGQLNTSGANAVVYTGTASKKYTATAICGTDTITQAEGVPEGCSELTPSGTFTCYLLITQFVG